MIETYATATDFRKYVAQITNCVGYRQDRCVITRHGQEIAALVSYEDLEFLRRHKPRKIGPPSVNAFSAKASWTDHFPDDSPKGEPLPPPGTEMVTLRDPEEMSIEDVKAFYFKLKPRQDESIELAQWLIRARWFLLDHRIDVPPH
jgi:hypothetical protein